MDQSVPESLAEYPFALPIEVRFCDLDMLGHVNNSVYATFVESARIAYYMRLTEQPLEKLDIILAELTLTYRAPAYFGDLLYVGLRITSIGTKSFVMEHSIVRAGDNAGILGGRSVLVAYDYKTGKTVPISEEFKRRVMAFQANGDPEHAGEQGEGV